MAHRFSVEEVEGEIDEDEPSPRQQAYNLFQLYRQDETDRLKTTVTQILKEQEDVIDLKIPNIGEVDKLPEYIVKAKALVKRVKALEGRRTKIMDRYEKAKKIIEDNKQ